MMLKSLLNKIQKRISSKLFHSNDGHTSISSTAVVSAPKVTVTIESLDNGYKVEISDYLSAQDYDAQTAINDPSKITDKISNNVLWNSQLQKITRGIVYVIEKENKLLNLLIDGKNITIDIRTVLEDKTEEKIIKFNLDNKDYRYTSLKHDATGSTFFNKYYSENSHLPRALQLTMEEAYKDLTQVLSDLETIGTQKRFDINLLKNFILNDLKTKIRTQDKKIFLSRGDLETLERPSIPSSEATEGQFYFYNTEEGRKLLKIIGDKYNYYSKLSLKNAQILLQYSDVLSTFFPELVLPEQLLFLDEELEGFLMEFIEGENLMSFLNNPQVQFNKKINAFVSIGEVLERNKAIPDFPYKFNFGDLHEGNIIMNQEGKVRFVDTNGIQLNQSEIPNCKYVKMFRDDLLLFPKKYQQAATCEIIPSHDTDLFCYGIMLLNYISKSNISQTPFYKIEKYLQYLQDIGFPREFMQAFHKLYSSAPNENFKDYLTSLNPSLLDESSFKQYQKRLSKK